MTEGITRFSTPFLVDSRSAILFHFIALLSLTILLLTLITRARRDSLYVKSVLAVVLQILIATGLFFCILEFFLAMQSATMAAKVVYFIGYALLYLGGFFFINVLNFYRPSIVSLTEVQVPFFETDHRLIMRCATLSMVSISVLIRSCIEKSSNAQPLRASIARTSQLLVVSLLVIICLFLTAVLVIFAIDRVRRRSFGSRQSALIRHPDARQRIAAVAGLRSLGADVVKHLNEGKTSAGIWWTILKREDRVLLKKFVLPGLLQASKDMDYRVRNAALSALRDLGAETAAL